MRWSLVVMIAVLLVSAGTITYQVLPVGDTDVAPAAIQDLGSFRPSPGVHADTTCIVQDDDIRLDQAMHRTGNIVIISRTGDIWVDAPISTADGADGDTPESFPPTDSIPHYYLIGDSGQDAGDIIILAPEGTIHVSADLRTGTGGEGLGIEQSFDDLDHRQSFIGHTGDQHIYGYAGYGGFGGSIYLGGSDVEVGVDTLYPGPGGDGGDAILHGALIHDTLRGGHGGMGGQAYLLDPALTMGLSVPGFSSSDEQAFSSGSPSTCRHPIPFAPDQELAATVIQPAQPTCRGGDGGDAITTGLYGSSPKYGWDETIAGVAIGGNGGWGCPGGHGGDARSIGAGGNAGRDGDDGLCEAPLVGTDGGDGAPGDSGGLGGHAFGGDGGAGAPGQNLKDSDAPNPLLWFFGWGGPKTAHYGSDPGWPTTWDDVPGQASTFGADFPIIGDDRWYTGGDGGLASSHGGQGGDGGDGGAGGDGPSPGKGGASGNGGRGAGPTSVHGGWSGPGAVAAGTPGATEAVAGEPGLTGTPGEDGDVLLTC